MSTELREKLSALNLIARGLEQLSQGLKHEPDDGLYDVYGSLIALGAVVISAGAVLSPPISESALGLVGRLLVIVGSAAGSLAIYGKFMRRALTNKPTWDHLIAEELAVYQPVDKKSWGWLHEQLGAGDAVDLSALDVWLSAELSAVRKLIEEPKSKALIKVGSERGSDFAAAD